MSFKRVGASRASPQSEFGPQGGIVARVLVVEDNAANLKLALLLVSKAGHQALSATDGETGVELARRERPDLILMDVQMPGMDGMQATQLLKADPRTAGIPVIAMTALAMKGDEQRILAAGCDGYIAKPFSYHDFLARIAAALEAASNGQGDGHGKS
jgi:two-component system cell cycle response regulator DivK